MADLECYYPNICISLKEKNDYDTSLNACKTAYRELTVKHSFIERQLANRSSLISNDESSQSVENSKKFISSYNNTVNLTLFEHSFGSFLLYGIQQIQRALEENIDLKNVKIFIENIEEGKQDNVTKSDAGNEVWNNGNGNKNIYAYNDSLHEKSFASCACKKIFHI